MIEHLQMYMKNKTTHLQVSNWQREKLPSDATHPTSAQSILKPEYIVYTMYAIRRDGLVHRRQAVIFSPLTSALTETNARTIF